MPVPPDAFGAGDVYIAYPYEDAKFRWDKERRKVFRRFTGEEEVEIPSTSDLYTQAQLSGHRITREEYYRD